jgi:hypothetical protein
MRNRTTPARRRKLLNYTLVLGMAGAVCPDAKAMRCGTALIGQGDTAHEVLMKCGPPTLVESGRWIYDRGPNAFTKILRFGGGQVQFVDDGQYGSNGKLAPLLPGVQTPAREN